mgnify:CR=1 FL=1
MKWAKNLRVDDVVRVELTIMPQATDKQYKDFNADEIAEAVALINKVADGMSAVWSRLPAAAPSSMSPRRTVCGTRS